jgi:hypothetical protein
MHAIRSTNLILYHNSVNWELQIINFFSTWTNCLCRSLKDCGGVIRCKIVKMQVLTSSAVKMTDFWVMAPCSLGAVSQQAVVFMCIIALLGFIHRLKYKIIRYSVPKFEFRFCLQLKRGEIGWKRICWGFWLNWLQSSSEAPSTRDSADTSLSSSSRWKQNTASEHCTFIITQCTMLRRTVLHLIILFVCSYLTTLFQWLRQYKFE